MQNPRTLIAVIIVLVFAVAVEGYLAFSRFGAFGQRHELHAPAILQEVQQLNELSTVKYSIQKVVGLREDKVPVGSESILLVVQGTVVAGIDLKELAERDIEIQKDRVLLKLPQAKILHVYLDDKHTQVWDRKVTWWTPWVPYNPDLERQARLRATEEIRKQAEEMGILRDAKRNAEQSIQSLLRTTSRVEVIFPPS
ncbi:hypothetical protein F183_A41880 [Bryobacterales bacterium F-183]|nr:hypothetical protein F183_A41880 [Bryobacterales bacterium F-183]